jgi:type IX secretion system PorP/SprF family membrane protein
MLRLRNKALILKLCAVFIFTAFSNLLNAQDIRFSQFYANKLYLNPALAGSTNYANVSLNYRNQWPNLEVPFVTYSVAFDNFYENINGGIGIMAIQDDQGDGALKTTRFSGCYSFYLRLSNYLVIRPALQATFIQKSIDWNKLVFPDQVDPIYGNILPHNTTGDPGGRDKGGVDFTFGTVAYFHNFYGGLVVNHIARPDLSFDENESDQVEAKYTFHGGAEFVIKGRTKKGGDWRLSPALLFQKQGEFSQMNYGLYVSKMSVVLGLWFNQNFELNYDSFIAMIGLATERLKIGYSYDYAVSRLSHTNAGAHEVSISFPVGMHKKKRRRHRAVRSPIF